MEAILGIWPCLPSGHAASFSSRVFILPLALEAVLCLVHHYPNMSPSQVHTGIQQMLVREEKSVSVFSGVWLWLEVGELRENSKFVLFLNKRLKKSYW